MRSKTKPVVRPETIARLFDAAGLPGAQAISPLGDGEFSAVFSVSACGKEFVIKLAPPDDAPVLSYERAIMEAELFWYDALRRRADVRVPEIVRVDFSKTLVPVSYLIMERLPGTSLNKTALSRRQKAFCAAETARTAARIHRVENDWFGYVQSERHDTWYEAIRAMCAQLIGDCARKNRRCRRGERLLQCVERRRAILESAPCRMVNFDLWGPNILVNRKNGGLELGWIDPERSFWGDPMADFVCLEFTKPLSRKTASLAAYNAAAETPVLATPEETVRWAAAQGYLALIMTAEKYFRYTPLRFGWWRNVVVSALLFRSAFRYLEAESSAHYG